MKLFTKYRTDLFFAGMLFCTACAILVSCSYSLESTVFACSFLLLPFSFLLSVTGQFLRSIAFASAIIISVYMLDRLKDHYYTSPLLFPDFQILMDSNNWETMVQYPWVGLVFILLFVLLAYSVSLSRKKDKRYGYMIRSSGVVVIILCVMLSNYFSHSELTKQDWEKNLTVRRYNNTFSNLIMSVNGFTYQSPKIVADDRLFKQSLAALPVSVLSEGVDGKLPNIIVWLQESTVNPQIFDIPCAQWPKLTMFEPQSDTVVTNWLRVHTFGGGTWKSEFTLLSGLPSTDFGSSAETVYYNVTPHLSYSLPKFLKEKGYYTIVLIATEKNAYNANNAYRDLGFDLVLQPQDIGLNVDKNQNLWKTSSSEMARYTKNVLSVYPNKPVFIFMLTVREHGPYDSTKIPAYGLDQCMNTKAAGSLSDYIERLEALDKATEDFNRYLIDSNHPYLFAYFGDHQPKIESSSFDYRIPFVHPDFVTQFSIHSNLPKNNTQHSELMDLAFLAGFLIEEANLIPNDFFAANIAMRKKCDAKLEDCVNKELLKSYRAYLYNTMKVAENN